MTQQYAVPVTFNILGLSDLKEANTQLARMGGNTGPVAKTTKSTAKFGYVAQNASYQVQDLIVQIQGGTNPMRALSQQLPQMAVGMGAWGAAIGLAAAAIPALIVAIRGSNAEMKDMDTLTAELGDSVSNLGRTLNTLDLSNWVEEFNKASDAQREFMLQTLEFDRVMAERARRDAANSINFQPVTSLADAGARYRTSITGGVAQQISANQNAAEDLGLTVAAYKQLAPIYERVVDSQGKDQEAVAELRAGLIAYNSTLDANNEKLNEQIDLTWELTKANQALIQAREVEVRARDAGSDGTISGVSGTADPRDDKLTAEGISFMESRREALEYMKNNSGQVAQSMDLATTAVGLFETQFEQAVVGIARGTQTIGDAVQSMADAVIASLVRMAAEWLATQAMMSLFGPSFGAPAAAAPNANGNVLQGGQVQAFAKGGVISTPTMFPMAHGGAGVMSEVAPEAIMPLGRNSRGELGVKGSATVNNISIITPPGHAAEVQETENESGGFDLGIVVRQIESAIAGNVGQRKGPMFQALQSGGFKGRLA